MTGDVVAVAVTARAQMIRTHVRLRVVKDPVTTQKSPNPNIVRPVHTKSLNPGFITVFKHI